MDTVRIGIVGLGGMGARHLRTLLAGEVSGASLTAVCDVRPERLAWAREHPSSDLACFDDLDAFLKAGAADAVIIATRHYDHPPLAVRCFAGGLHVLTEKPAGVYTKQVGEMNRAAAASGKVFAIMYNQRTDPLYRRLKEMIEGGELGEIKRTNWIITSWYRPQSYYDRDDWRATWAGEGGGVLINQAPHQLDLWQWCCGMPARLRAFCYFGKHHDIEAEDDVTAFVEYPNGATGVFVTSTGDAPGSNRLEVTGDNGKLVVEDDRLTFWRLDVPEPRFRREHRTGSRPAGVHPRGRTGRGPDDRARRHHAQLRRRHHGRRLSARPGPGGDPRTVDLQRHAPVGVARRLGAGAAGRRPVPGEAPGAERGTRRRRLRRTGQGSIRTSPNAPRARRRCRVCPPAVRAAPVRLSRTGPPWTGAGDPAPASGAVRA